MKDNEVKRQIAEEHIKNARDDFAAGDDWIDKLEINSKGEFKTTLTKTDFLAILNQFDFEPGFSQMNTYYDTPTGAVKKAGLGLRIRQFKDRAEQTLKVPNKNQHRDLEEITDPLTSVEARSLIDQGQLKTGQVTAKRRDRNIESLGQALNSNRLRLIHR